MSQAVRKVTAAQIIIGYNQGLQKNIPEHKAHPPLGQMGYNMRGPTRCHFCQLRTETSDYNSHRVTKIGQ